MAMYNTSSAYDLSEFENALKKDLENPALKSPELKVVKNRKSAPSSILGPGAVCAFLIIVALVTLMIYNRVQLNELTEEINQLTSELEILHSENVKMATSLEATISHPEVAKLAEEMGMQKRTEFQTKRIYLYQQDKIERTDATPQKTVSDNAKLAVSSFLGRFKEYLGER